MAHGSKEAIEQLVVARIAEIVDGSPRRIDDGSTDGLHDHEIDLTNGRTAAVEVTGDVDAATLATGSATRKYRLTHSGVTRLWDVSLADWNSNRRKLARRLPAILIEYEGSGRHYVAAEDDPRLGALAIVSVQMHDLAGHGIYLTRVGSARSVGPVDVLDAVSDHGSRLDNTGKLGRADVDERHLAVWIDVSAGDAYVALNDFGLLPDQDPAIDDVIDTVWAMRLDRTGSGPEIDIVWRWTRGAGWTYHGRSPTVLNDDR